MKILASGDNHFDEKARFDECVRVHAFMVDVAREERVDLFICPGDLYERASTPDERAAAAAWLVAMAEVCPVLLVRGNHDRKKDCALLARLTSRHPIIVEEGAEVHHIAGAAIAAMAWPDRANLAAHFAGQSTDELDQTAQDLFRNVLLGFRQQLDAHDGPRILAGHFMVDGSVTSVGQPLVGHGMSIGLSDLALCGAPLVLMAHIHKPQSWTFGDTEIVYTGSPYRTTYGEVEEKSAVLAEFDGARLVEWRRIPTPCAPMYLATDEWDGERQTFVHGWDGLPELDTEGVRGAEIRLRYQVDQEHREAARADAESMRDELLNRWGAVDVKVDPQLRSKTRARVPEIAKAQTREDQLKALWKAQNREPDATTAKRLLGKVTEIQKRKVSA